MNKLKKIFICGVTSLLILSSMLFTVYADSVKTGGLVVMGSYTWATAQLKVY